MLRIGDFARLSQVSVKALRFYDETGLLKPSFVDRSTGYRYYAPHLLMRVNQILAFKELGFSLTEIADLLQSNLSDEQVRAALRRKRHELSQGIARAQAQLTQVDDWLQQLSESAPQPLIHIKQVPVQLVASRRATLASYDEAEELFDELQHHLRRHQRGGQRAAIWHTCANNSQQIECEALIWLNQRVPEQGRVRVYELPGGAAASIVHAGADETIEQTYRAIRRWVKTQQYQVAGPNREIYWPDAQAPNTQAKVSSLTEIQFPVFITPKPSGVGN